MRGRHDAWWQTARASRALHLLVAITRILIGFALLPAGLKKLLGQPFTAPENHGPFHDFLHAFHATGIFYRFVGAVQLLCATLLMTQRFASAGAVLTLPVVTTILVFCWSTGVVPTATVVTAMFLATVGLLVWDWPRFRGLDVANVGPVASRSWEACGLGIVVGYLALCAITGEVYRPKPGEPRGLGFWVLSGLAVTPLATLALEFWRGRQRARVSERQGNTAAP